MKRLGFKSLALAALWVSNLVSTANTNEFRGYWVDVFHPGLLTSAQVTTLVDTMRSANCNAIIAEIRARANAYYNGSPYEPKGPGISPSTFDPLGDLLAKGHDTSNGKQRLEIHAWMVMFKTSVNQPAAWLHKNYSGGVSTTEYCPGHPDVQRRVYDVAMDIASRYDIDGLNYDYVRYPENNELGPSVWGYNDVTVARFNSRFGRTGIPELNDPVWNQFRRDQVTSLVRKIYLNVMAIKPWVKVSADTITWNPSPASITDWTNSARAYNDVFQDWRSWMEEGILDYSVPMNYYRNGVHPQDFINWMNFAKDHQYEHHTVIGPGTYLNFATNVFKQMWMTREQSPNGNYARGFCGYSYAFPSTNNIVPAATIYNALVQPSAYDTNPVPIFAEKATIPEMPWKTNPTKGHLKGFVTGATATNYLDGATISISGPLNRSFISDATGFFGSAHLPPGLYTLEASFTNHVTVTTNFTVTNGLVTTRDLTLPVIAPPTFITHPLDLVVTVGSNALFSVSVSGSEPFSYQWKRNGTNIAGAQGIVLNILNVTTNDNAATFSVIVSNGYGTNESQSATLTVTPVPVVIGTSPLFDLKDEDRDYLSLNTTERGLTYNAITDRLLLISRTPSTAVYVLDGETGYDLHTLNITNISGGQFILQMVGAADDGVIYAGNLVLNNSSPFRLYRWDDDSTSAVPILAFSDDPGIGNNQRWGDTFDVRGSGTNTQVLLGSRLGGIVSILTTTNGTNFSARPITISGAANGSFGLGVAWGQSNTFWGKTTNNALRQVSFDLIAGTGAVIRTISDPSAPGTMAPIGVSVPLDLLAGISFETPDNVRLYDLAGSGSPRLLATVNFPTDNANTFFVGSIDFGRDKVYALNPNNGIIAFRLHFPMPPAPFINAITPSAGDRVRLWFESERRPYTVEATTNFSSWNPVTNEVPVNDSLEVDAQGSVLFYRLRLP